MSGERYRREKAAAKAAAERWRLEEQPEPACAYCGARPAKRCPPGDGRHVAWLCADCWPKVVG